MAPWKRLTDISNFEVEVNMGEVCYMRQLPNHTALYFDTQVVTVRESISESGLRRSKPATRRGVSCPIADSGSPGLLCGSDAESAF